MTKTNFSARRPVNRNNEKEILRLKAALDDHVEKLQQRSVYIVEQIFKSLNIPMKCDNIHPTFYKDYYVSSCTFIDFCIYGLPSSFCAFIDGKMYKLWKEFPKRWLFENFEKELNNIAKEYLKSDDYKSNRIDAIKSKLSNQEYNDLVKHIKNKLS